MMQLDYEAMHREAASAEPMIANLTKVEALANRNEGKGKPGQPLSEYMLPADSAEFAALHAQAITISFNELMESRRQRDMKILRKMQTLSEADRKTGLALKPGDLDLQVYSYLFAMKTVMRGVYRAVPASSTECSLDLALENEAAFAIDELKTKVVAAPEFYELVALRDKYGLATGTLLDPSKLTKAEQKRLPTLMAVTQTLLRGQSDYQENVIGLKWFSDVSQMLYEWQRANILQFGAGDLSDYDKADAVRYAALSEALQKGVNVWRNMDVEFPAQITRNWKIIADSHKTIQK